MNSISFAIARVNPPVLSRFVRRSCKQSCSLTPAAPQAKLQALEELTTTGPELTLRDGLVTELKTLVHWAFPCPEVLATTAEQLYGMLKREARSEAHVP